LKNKYLWVGAIFFAVLVLDQATKYLVMKHIPWHGTITIIPGFFDLTYVKNPGAAFGILSGDHGMWRKVFFVSVTLIALGVIAVLIRKTHERLLVVAFSLIAGGAIGNNLIDRVRYGMVVDFIEWYYKSYHWPTFNIADSAISVGVGLLVVDMFLKKPKDTEKTV
jgi:signal peptidase II